jgi:hypothetical protein
MKLTSLWRFCSAFVLSISSLLLLSLPVVHALSYCTWTGSGDGVTFSDASNWTGSCSGAGGIPGSGDNLEFDNTSLSSQANLTDDISGVTFSSVTFAGSNTSYSFVIGGTDMLSLSGANSSDTTLIDTTTSLGGEIDSPLTITTSSTITIANALYVGNLGNSIDNNFNIGSNTIEFTGSGTMNNDDLIIGTGTIDADFSSSEGSFNDAEASPGFTGNINVASGALAYISSSSTVPDMFANASGINISNGASFGVISFSSDASNVTIAEPITVVGEGPNTCTYPDDSSLSVCGAIGTVLGDNSTLTLSGSMTLAGNAVFNSLNPSDTIAVTGSLSGAYTITADIGNLDISSNPDTSSTPDGLYAGIDDPASSTSASSSSGTAAKTVPKAPNTGVATIAANPLKTATIAIFSSLVLLLIVKKIKTSEVAERK